MMGQILIALIALLHVYILVLEMFLWDKPYGLKAFGNTPTMVSWLQVYFGRYVHLKFMHCHWPTSF